MKTVSQITDALFQLAPAYMKEDWDNIGQLCGRADQPVERVLVALDPCLQTAQEARAFGAQLLVTHHPLIFSGIKAVSDQSAAGRTLLYLIENSISAVNMHTNLDAAPGGVNDCLAEALGLEALRVLQPAGTDAQGRSYGLGRIGMTAPCSLQSFLQRVKDALQCGGLRYADGGKPVACVAVGGGACGDFLQSAAACGCDTFVTADVKYHQFIEARELGLNLIDAGHFPTENLICGRIAESLRSRFPDLEILVSQTHEDAVKFL